MGDEWQSVFRSTALRVTVVYAVLAGAWIVGSDQLVGVWWSDDVVRMKQAQMAKGLVFVGLMGGVIYAMVARSAWLERKKRDLEAMLAVAEKLEVVGTFAASIVHDMGNIVAVLEGYASLMRREVDRGHPVNPDHMDGVDRSIERAMDLTRQLSAFLRNEEGQTAVIAVSEQIEQNRSLLERAVGSRVTLETQVAAAVPSIELRVGGLEQILLNLVVNARDAIGERRNGSVRLGVARVTLNRRTSLFCPQPRSGEFVRVEVEDNGGGIPREKWVRVFDPFFTTKPAGVGTGLGLASVMRLMQEHGGWVELRSAVGRGTTVSLYFPAATNLDPLPVLAGV